MVKPEEQSTRALLTFCRLLTTAVWHTVVLRDDLFRVCSGSSHAEEMLLAAFPSSCVAKHWLTGLTVAHGRLRASHCMHTLGML